MKPVAAKESSMNTPNTVVESLVLDLVEWVAGHEKTYEEVMEAWRTSCPRLQVWEEANVTGLVVVQHSGDRTLVRPTALGLLHLELRKEQSRTNRSATRRTS